MKTKRLDDIAVLRVFCILVVVLFHCYQMMYAAGHFSNSVEMYKELYYVPVQCGVINVGMPLFVYISGYLFKFLLQQGKYPTWKNLLQKKGIRILLPFFVFGLFFMVSTNGWHPQTLLTGDYWHLWFLPMLFWSFIIGYGLNRAQCDVRIELLILVFFFVGRLVPPLLPMWFGLHSISRWFYWFYLGMLSYKYRDFVFDNLGGVKFAWILLFISLAILCLYPVAYGEIRRYDDIAVTFCVLSISYLMSRVAWSKYKVITPVVKFSSYSFGIYIWHNWVALMLISKTSQRLFGLPELAANHVILFPLCFSLITLAISWGLSWAMMKTKVGKFLIG